MLVDMGKPNWSPTGIQSCGRSFYTCLCHWYRTVSIVDGNHGQRNGHVLDLYISHTHQQTVPLTERQNKYSFHLIVNAFVSWLETFKKYRRDDKFVILSCSTTSYWWKFIALLTELIILSHCSGQDYLSVRKGKMGFGKL